MTNVSDKSFREDVMFHTFLLKIVLFMI